MLVDKTNCGFNHTDFYRFEETSSYWLELHGPPMLFDKFNLGLVLYNHTNFYRLEETFSYLFVICQFFSPRFIGQPEIQLRHHSV